MKSRNHQLLLIAVCLLVLGLAVFTTACSGSKDATTTTVSPASTTAAPSTDTTASAATGTSGTMVVKGMVGNPRSFTVNDLKAMKTTTITAEHPKKGSMEYTGVLLSDIMAAVSVQPGATVLDMGASDGYMGEVTLAELDPNCMIAIAGDGKLNAVMPGQSGKAWVSDVISLDFK
jgi:hypothetical protein